MTGDILHVHPHHTLQACAFGLVILEGYSLGHTQGSLLLELKEQGQRIMLQLVRLLQQQQVTRQSAFQRTAPGAPVHQDFYMDFRALAISLYQLELVQVREMTDEKIQPHTDKWFLGLICQAS